MYKYNIFKYIIPVRYKMSQELKKQTRKDLLYNPTLSSVLMVEETAEKYSQECGKYQLWKKLPNKMMYQTYLVILDYLVSSGKILIDKDGCVLWIWNPARIRKAVSEGLIVR